MFRSSVGTADACGPVTHQAMTKGLSLGAESGWRAGVGGAAGAGLRGASGLFCDGVCATVESPLEPPSGGSAVGAWVCALLQALSTAATKRESSGERCIASG